ncbi:MAG: AMP-dependent synthetase and ligase [Sphingomonadales bacterium]|nr:AMP-dependent synthetase and ligase [Sphingomonadales bacterium]
MVTALREREGILAAAPFRPLSMVAPQVSFEERADGTFLLRDPRPVAPCEASIIAYLRRWAGEAPDRSAFAQRTDAGAWRHITYSELRRDADAVAQWLIDTGVSAGQMILILSENSIEHATIALGAMTVGVAITPVSPAYSLVASGYAKLQRVVDAVRPALIFAQNGARFANAVGAIKPEGVRVVAVSGISDTNGIIPFSELLATKPTDAVETAYAATGPDTVAKILFSSGSTGWPKGIVNTQRMMCLNMAMVDTLWLTEEHTKPYVTLNWMPWNHTMAGNGLFNRSLRQGGTYYIDDGRPLPGEFEQTVRNLRGLSPHSYSDVPAGFAMLAAALEADDDLLEQFFRNLVFLQYAGASLPTELWQRLQRLSIRATGKKTPFLTGYGCTEAGPLITQLYWCVEGSGYIGLPVPGVEIKLIAVDSTRYEIRVRGPNITPAYLHEPKLYAESFDEEGFYKTGDSVTFVDPSDALKGFRFASRVAEDFKLLTGTFVAVGTIRATAVGMLIDLARDMVITGHDRAFVGALIWPDLSGCRTLLGSDAEALSDTELIRSPEVIAAFRTVLADYNRANNASSMRIDRALLLDEPPVQGANEITDKGYVNQRMVLDRRAALVQRLYAEPVDPDVILISNRVEP